MKKIIVLLLLAMVLALAACTGSEEPAAPEPAPVEEEPTPTPEPTPEEEDATTEPDDLPSHRQITDREGYTVTVPNTINSIISIGPANTEIIAALGAVGQIIYTDMFSDGVPGLASGINVLDMMALDLEFIIDQNPDIVFVTGMTRVGGVDPMGQVVDMGISVVHIPMSESISSIMEDIRFIAYVLGNEAAGADITANMENEFEAARQIAAGIETTRTVYFEVSPAPWMFSFGHGTFLNEIIELVGATNIFADAGWLGVSDEQILEHNPDVIITSVDFMDDAVAEILEREGWEAITAVENGAVFQVDADASSRPSQNITTALWEIATAIFPEYFGQ